MPTGKPNPDHLLAPEQFPELNRAFYATKPWAYFNYRNHLLMLAAGAGDRLEEIAQEGVSYRGARYQEKPDEEGADDGEAQERSADYQARPDIQAALKRASRVRRRKAQGQPAESVVIFS